MKTVAFFGSSTLAGKGQAFNIIAQIQKNHHEMQFVNLGEGGDNAHDALKRVDLVLKSKPDIVIILIGANDVLIEIFPKLKKLLNFIKRSPQASNPGEFEKNVRTIVKVIKEKTSAKVVLSSLGLVGENVTDPGSTQRNINDSVKLHSEVIRNIATEEKTDYLPFYEGMYKVIERNPGKSYDDFKILPMYRDAFRALVLGWTPDNIAIKNGWNYHSDGIHLNSKGAAIFIELVEEYLRIK